MAYIPAEELGFSVCFAPQISTAQMRINNWFGRRWCELLLAWLEEADRVLDRPDDE